MADFNIAFEKTVVQEGTTWAGSEKDSGNFYKGVLVGSKFGVTGQAYYDYYKRIPTKAIMQNLTKEDIKPIKKKNFWDKILGDNISNQAIANLTYDWYVHKPSPAVENIAKIVNTPPTTALQFSAKMVQDINASRPEIAFNAIKQARIKHAKGFFGPDTLKGVLNRINRYNDYPAICTKPPSVGYLITDVECENNTGSNSDNMGIFVLIGLGIFLFMNKKA